MSRSLRWIPEALADLERRDLLRKRRLGAGGARIDFGSNDYLGLAADPRLAAAAAEAAKEYGWGAGASPAVSGRTELHERLENRLADFEGAEATLLFPSGYAANSGVIPALVGDGDAIYADAKNHASLIDGCRLSRAERFIYPHGDAQALASMLSDSSGFRRRLIVTDTLFSMDGDFAPLDRLADLAAAYDAMLLVDEAHATGVWGESGRGLVEHFAAQSPGVEAAVAVRIGTLSKALGASGGFVTGSRAVIDWLANRARPYVYSTAAPAATAGAALTALEIASAEPERRRRVINVAVRLRKALMADGWRLGASTSQVIPILIEDPGDAVRLSRRLLDRGVYAPAIRPPSVPEGESLLRISVSAAHADDEVDALVEGLRAIRAE